MHEEKSKEERLAAFDTTALLRAVDDLDAMRVHLDGDGYKPQEMRNDLLPLHQLAMRIVNEGSTDPTTNAPMFDLATDREYRIDDLAHVLDAGHDRRPRGAGPRRRTGRRLIHAGETTVPATMR